MTARTLSRTAFTCADLGNAQTTLTVRDASNNQGVCAASTVQVQDTTAPTCLAQTVTVTLDATGAGTTTAAAVDNGSTDNW